MPRYFQKELPTRPLYLPIGRPLEFEHIDDDYGYLKTDDGYIIQELLNCIARGAGGVSEVTEAVYLEWLKKKSKGPSPRLLRQRETIGASGMRRRGGGQVAGAVGTNNQTIIGVQDNKAVTSVATPQRSEGLKVDRTFAKPNVGRIQ